MLRAVVAALCLSVLTAGSSQAQNAPPRPEKSSLTIAVGGKTVLYYLPLTIAERLDLFRKNGLSVEIIDFQGGAKSLQAVVGGSADIVSGAFEHTIAMQVRKQRFRAFVLMGATPQLGLVVRSDMLANYRSPKDLEGMAVGVSAPGSSTNMLLNVVLARAGVALSSVPVIGVGATATQNVAAIVGKRVPVLSTAEPIMSMIERDGLGKVVVDTRSPASSEEVFGGPMPGASLYAPQEFADRNPTTVLLLTKSIVQALAWLAKATPDQVADLVPPDYLLGDRDLYKQAIVRVKQAY